MTVVDVWAQITTPRMAEQPWMATLLRWIGRSAEAVVPTPRDTITAMDDAGVDVALLSAWYGPTGALVSNDEVQHHLDAHPDRFRGLASADVRSPADAAREVRDRLTDDRFVGVRIVPWLWEVPPTDRRFYPLYVACVDAGVPLCTQIGHTGPLRPSETGRLIPHLEQVMLDFPDLVVVGGHVGFPWIDEVRSMTAKFENFFVDTSAYACTGSRRRSSSTSTTSAPTGPMTARRRFAPSYSGCRTRRTTSMRCCPSTTATPSS